MDPRLHLCEIDLHPLLIDHALAIRPLRLAGPVDDGFVGALDHARRTERHAFMVQLARDQLPALVQPADEVLGRNAHVIEEDRVDVVIREQLERVDANAPGLHVDEEHRQPAMLRRLLVGPHRQPAIVGIARETRPELLTVDDVVAAPSARSARVCSAARSVPAPGSL